MNRILLSTLLFFTFYSHAQENWILIDTKINNELKRPKEVINIVNEENGDIVMFFRYAKFINAFLFDKNRKLIQELHIEQLPKFSDNYLGCGKSNNSYTLFFKNLASTKYSSLSINFESKKINSKDNIGISLKKEVFVESFEANNQVYILTSLKKSSKLKLYTLSFDLGIKTSMIDLSNEVFKKPSGIKVSFYTLIKGLNQEAKTNSIKPKEPSSLEIASAKNKIYFDNNVIVFTSNYFDNYTSVIRINILDGSYSYTKIDNLNFKKEDRGNNSNSFIYENYFFNMYVTRNQLNYDIYDLKTEGLIKTLSFKKEDSITFKNSPIILEGGDFSKYRELSRTAQFLRKVVSSNVSTYIYKNNNNFIITIGSSEPKPQGPILVYVGGALAGGIGVSVLLATAYLSYANTKSTRIECLFDDNFNHISGEIPLNGFDKVMKYTDTYGLDKAPLQTMFKYDDDYVFGFYLKNEGLYKFVKFND